MDNPPISTPRQALAELRRHIIPENTPENTIIELVIKISGENIVIRDLNAYFDLIDHTYGRLKPDGLRSYARKESGHLKFTEVRHGSFELIIQTVLAHLNEINYLLTIYLVLKYLPKFLHAMASSFNEYEQGMLARENRKRIKIEMQDDEELKNLSRQQRRDLITLIEALHLAEANKLPRANRFARKSLLDIAIRISKNGNKEKDEEND